ncbi:MAG: hypothetical protein V1721_08575 [Pseudomonadota bacterium]
MYTDSTLQLIYDQQQYVGENGTQYPANYPKDEILGLFPVTETPQPTGSFIVVTGFTINAQHVQVWQTRDKTVEELSGELKGQALSALAKSDLVAIRCIKAGTLFPADWWEYVTALRAIMNGAAEPLPAQPEYPEGT